MRTRTLLGFFFAGTAACGGGEFTLAGAPDAGAIVEASGDAASGDALAEGSGNAASSDAARLDSGGRRDAPAQFLGDASTDAYASTDASPAADADASEASRGDGSDAAADVGDEPAPLPCAFRCAGCCEGDVCRPGNVSTLCGSGGAACIPCPSGASACTLGVCH